MNEEDAKEAEEAFAPKQKLLQAVCDEEQAAQTVTPKNSVTPIQIINV